MSPKRANASQVGVQVPRTIRDSAVTHTAVAVYAVLSGRARDGQVTITLAGIMAALGRPGRATDSAARAVDELAERGWIRYSQRRHDTARTYRVRSALDLGGRYDVVPRTLLTNLEAGKCSAALLRFWCHLDQALGRAGWTADSAHDLGRRFGIGERAARRYTAALTQLGLLVCTITRASRLLARRTATPTDRPHSQIHDDLHRGEVKPASGVKSDLTHKDIPPETRPPENFPSSAPRAEPHLTLERVRAAAERPKKTRSRSGVTHRPDVAALLDRLPGEWTRGSARRWRGGLGTLVAARLDHGLGPEAITWALREVLACEDLEGRHLPLARQALTTLAADVRHGLACPGCGRDDRWRRGVCARCGDDSVDDGHDKPPLRERIAFYRHLGISPDELAVTDPEAAAAITSQDQARQERWSWIRLLLRGQNHPTEDDAGRNVDAPTHDGREHANSNARFHENTTLGCRHDHERDHARTAAPSGGSACLPDRAGGLPRGGNPAAAADDPVG